MKRIIFILNMSHNIFVLNFWSIVDKKVLPVSGVTMGTGHHRPHHFTGQGYQRREREEISSVSRFAVSPSAAQERGPPTNIINAAMKYYDKTQFGRDRTPGDPQRFHNVNSLV